MAVGLNPPKNLTNIDGIKLGVTSTGIRYSNRNDLLLMEIAEGSSVSAVFTQNIFCAAPVEVAKQNITNNHIRALLINSGNANAATGELGHKNALLSCKIVADKLGINTEQVLPFSTGVIGQQLNIDLIESGVDAICSVDKDATWRDAAETIMTTDTIAKAYSKTVVMEGRNVSITGIAKGSGMINPDMATMLAYVATDASIEPSLLDTLLKKSVKASFNRITVDSDTSTNDALVLIASGQSQTHPISEIDSENALTFYHALEEVMIELATAIIRDGEGATKFVKVEVQGGVSDAACKAVAYSVAHSPLVKTALYASDPNWGRLVMAIGKTPDMEFKQTDVSIKINGLALVEHGQPAPGYTEEQGQAIFDQEEITISVDLNSGDGRYHVWTSDLSHDYVSINADYRS